jgi:hypothetical protein
VEIESFVLSNIISHPGKQDEVIEALGHTFLQVRGKDPSGVGILKSRDSLNLPFKHHCGRCI